MDAIVGSFMNSAAAIEPPIDCVDARTFLASLGVHTPAASSLLRIDQTRHKMLFSPRPI
jgi:hypothetical protein